MNKTIWSFTGLFMLLSACVLQAATLKIYWIDVEGGGATLLVAPSGESILVDAGEGPRDATRIHEVATKVAGLKQIDIFVVTHWHADHYGGASYLSKMMPIESFFANEPPPVSVPEDVAFPKLMPQYKAVAGDRTTTLKPGDTLAIRQSASGPRLTATVLAADRRTTPPPSGAGPNSECQNAPALKRDDTQNSKSVVLLFRYGNFTFFDAGDLTRDREAQLVCPINRVGEVTLYQTDHHGLDLSNNPVLIRSLKPRVVVVNNGPLKGAEHDTMTTLLNTPGIETIWQIHRNLQPGRPMNADLRYVANQEINCKAQFLRATVQPDGAFSVAIGSNGVEKQYGPKR